VGGGGGGDVGRRVLPKQYELRSLEGRHGWKSAPFPPESVDAPTRTRWAPYLPASAFFAA
jgi:hypothetical protein